VKLTQSNASKVGGKMFVQNLVKSTIQTFFEFGDVI